MLLDELFSPVATVVKDYSGSLDFIDSLPTKAPISLKLGAVSRWREAAAFSNVLTSNVNLVKPLPARRLETPASDGRTFHPDGPARPLVEYSPDASKLQPYDPYREIDKHIERARRPNPFSKGVQDRLEMQAIKLRFSIPERLKICLDRWARREVMHALGHAGRPVARFRRITELSKIKC